MIMLLRYFRWLFCLPDVPLVLPYVELRERMRRLRKETK